MNLTELVAQIEFRLGGRKNITDKIKGEIELAQLDLERDPKLNLFFLSRSFVFQTYLTERSYPMPNDWIKMNENQQPYFMDSNESITYLKRKSAHKVFRPAQAGVPQTYALEAVMMVLDVPADGVVRIFYYGQDEKLTDLNQENNWTRFAPNVLLLKAAMNVAKTLRDMELFNVLNAEYQISYENLYRTCVSQEDTGFDIARGEDY